jgi:hypothetical protein
VNKCALEDVVFPVVIGSYIKDQDVIRDIAGRKFVNIKDLVVWMTRGTRMLGKKCTNALVVFEALIRNR